MDVHAAIKDDLVITAGSIEMIPANFSVEIPEGYEIQVRPRSGLAANNGITVLNSPGTIDSDYRGEVKIILFNAGRKDFVLKPAERIAQLVISKVFKAEIIETNRLNNTGRGTGGFGHTGR
jgi:dUTP pyrophosphatase